MRVDVVVAYHQPSHQRWWPAVEWGLRENLENIRKVWVVNDGPYEEGSTPSTDLPVMWLYHPKEEFGLCKSLNMGVEASDTEHVLIIEGDEILAPGALATNLEQREEGTLLCCEKRYIEPVSLAVAPIEDFGPTIIEEDHRKELLRYMPERVHNYRQWILCSGGHLLIHRATHEELGGFDEAYGYGLHDYDYAARWMLLKGPASVRYRAGGAVWHIGSGKGRKGPGDASWARFVKTLAPLFDHRFHLACGNKHEPNAVNVDFQYCWGADAYLDCEKLEWLEAGSANVIQHAHFLEHLPPQRAVAHLKAVYQKLAPGGRFLVECPDLEKCCKAYLEGRKEEILQALYSDPAHHERPGWQHFWGWDVATLSAALEGIGFEVDFAGDSDSEKFEWRDLLIEATKPCQKDDGS